MRYFKERGITPQFVDLDQRELSPGELENIFQHIDPEDAVDTGSKTFKKRKLDYIDYDAREELEENQALLRTPVVRFRKRATIGYDPDTWGEWATQARE